MSNKCGHWLKLQRCPVCGKDFYPETYHVYKDARLPHELVCTYTCKRESEKLYEKERELRAKQRTEARKKKKQ